MRASRSSLVVTCLCALLAACHAKPKPQPPAPTPPVKVAPARPPAVLPARQPGLWATTVTEEGSEDTPQSLKICIDAQTDKHLGILGTDLSGDTCKRTVSTTDDGWGLLAECNMGTGGVDEFSGSITGDYASDFSMKMRLQVTGASLPQMNRVTNYTVTSKRIGECAADQVPGDVVVNDSIKINLFGMAGHGAPQRPKADTADASPSGGD